MSTIPGHRNTDAWPPYLFEMANDPMLQDQTSAKVPHEIHAAVRAQRNGYSGSALTTLLAMKATDTIQAIRDGLTQEQQAHARGQTLCEGKARKGYK
jgi:hypothetical protein